MNINMRSKVYKGYTIYENGTILGKTGKKMTPGVDGRGYHFVFIYNNGIKNTEKIHRLVAKCFIPNPENKPQVNHKDGNKDNNCLNNLEWVTQSENMRHAFRLGLCENTRKAAVLNGRKKGLSTIRKAIESQEREVIDTATGEKFQSIKCASDKYGYKYDTLRSWLNGVNRNKSTLKYSNN